MSIKTIDQIPEYHEKEILSDNTTLYRVTCAYCGNEVQFKHSAKPSRCPHCGEKDYRKPKTETQLFKLQREYLNGDTEALGPLYLILKDYAKSIIKKNIPREFTYHFDKIEEKSSDAANLMIEQYLVKPGFKVDYSFGGYLQWKVKEVLWNKKVRKEENHDSLNSYLETEDDNIEGIDILSDHVKMFHEHAQEIDYAASNEFYKKDTEYGLSQVVDTIMKRVSTEYSTLSKLLLLGALLVKIDISGESDALLHRYYAVFGTDIKHLVDKSLLVMYQFLKERG